MRSWQGVIAGMVGITLAGCSSLPQQAYPVFDVSGSNGFSAADIHAAFDMTGASDMAKTKDLLGKQRGIYWYQASKARTGLLNLRTTTSVGVVAGAVGAIISNVATAASGAGLALGSTLLSDQYSLAAQDPIYSAAATSVGCLIAALNVNGAPSADTILVPAAQDASNQILDKVQSGLANLKPAAPNVSDLINAVAQWKKASADVAAAVGVNVSDWTPDAQTALTKAQINIVLANLTSCIETGKLASAAASGK